MNAPNKIYLCKDAPRAYDWRITPFKKGGNIEYIRKDLVDDMLKAAEEHAYLAGQEKFRERMLKWIEENNTDFTGPSWNLLKTHILTYPNNVIKEPNTV